MGEWVHRISDYREDQVLCIRCGWVQRKDKDGRPKCWNAYVEQKQNASGTEYRQRKAVAKTATHCGLCDVDLEPRRKYVDHDHASGRIRGVLCARCNARVAAVEAYVSEGALDRILDWIK